MSTLIGSNKLLSYSVLDLFISCHTSLPIIFNHFCRRRGSRVSKGRRRRRGKKEKEKEKASLIVNSPTHLTSY
jgi:hypothetical protein